MIQFIPLESLAPEFYADLHNDVRVRRHMPLAEGAWTHADAEAWIEEKVRQRAVNGVGVEAIVVDGQPAGWGGVQVDGDDFDLALVLAPRFWGRGLSIAKQMLQQAVSTGGISQLVILLPVSRRAHRAMASLGCVYDGIVQHSNRDFHRYRFIINN